MMNATGHGMFMSWPVDFNMTWPVDFNSLINLDALINLCGMSPIDPWKGWMHVSSVAPWLSMAQTDEALADRIETGPMLRCRVFMETTCASLRIFSQQKLLSQYPERTITSYVGWETPVSYSHWLRQVASK